MRALRILAGLLLMPVCVAATKTLLALLVSIHPRNAGGWPFPAWALVGGFLAWLLVYFTLPRPVRGYVLSHELTHALCAYVMGARVYRIRIGTDKGSVTLSKSNALIALAPYFFPFYTVLVIVAYYLLGIFHDLQAYLSLWLALVGFTWGFHFTFTLASLMQHQSDIREHGYLFSYALIYALNMLGICGWIVAVSPATLEQLARELQTQLHTVLASWGTAGRYIWAWFHNKSAGGSLLR